MHVSEKSLPGPVCPLLPPLLVLLSLLLVTPVFATPMLRVQLPDETAREHLRALPLDVAWWGQDYADVVGWPLEQGILTREGYTWTVETADLERFYASRLNEELDDMGGYATLAEIEAWMFQLAADHPDLVAGPDTIGTSLEGRPIYAFKVSDNPNVDEDEPELWVNAAIHAREVICPLIVMTFIDSLTNNYGLDDRITHIVEERELWVTPCMNPDGYYWNEVANPEGGGMWRKNRRGDGETVWGVDLNRNYPIRWGLENAGASHVPTSEVYCGEGPASEPETQVAMAFYNSHRFRSILHYHSYTNIVYMPSGIGWGAPFEYWAYLAAGQYFTSHIGWDTVNGGLSGGFTDWVDSQGEYTAFAFLFEVGGVVDGFWPSAARRPVLIAEHQEPLFRFCEIGDDPWRAVAPYAPLCTLPDSVGTTFTLDWDPSNNIEAAGYWKTDVAQRLDERVVDGAEEEATFGWEMFGFERSDAEAATGDWCYASINESHLTASITSIDYLTVEEGDVFRFDILYDIYPDSDFAAVLARPEGGVFEALTGSISNQPHGRIRGSSQGWTLAEFSLDDYVGQRVQLRIEYRLTFENEGAGLFIDNLWPSERFQVLETDLDGIELELDFSDLEEPLATGFILRGSNFVGALGRWGETVPTVIWPEGYTEVKETVSLPSRFRLSEAYPNPFNPTTRLEVELPARTMLHVELFNVVGQRVAVLASGDHEAGKHTLLLDGGQLASGVYIVRASILGQAVQSRKVLLMQ